MSQNLQHKRSRKLQLDNRLATTTHDPPLAIWSLFFLPRPKLLTKNPPCLPNLVKVTYSQEEYYIGKTKLHQERVLIRAVDM